MSNMGDLDIVLSEYKLSDAQKNAIVELIGGGFETAKANTIKSLINKGLVEERLDGYSLSDSLADAVRPILERNKALSETIEDLLESDPWGVKAVQDVMLTPVKDNFTEVLGWEPDNRGGEVGDKADSVEDVKPETFDYQLGVYSNTLMGFGDVYKWNNNRVWDGLTLQEIKEDIKTAFPVNRKARRNHTKVSRKILKSLAKVL